MNIELGLPKGMSRQVSARRQANQIASCMDLAEFLPRAVPVRIPVQVARIGATGFTGAEETVIEFGTPAEVLFASGLPLEFEDTVQIRTADGVLDVKAEIVAVQVHQGRTAVAARFLHEVSNWIIRK